MSGGRYAIKVKELTKLFEYEGVTYYYRHILNNHNTRCYAKKGGSRIITITTAELMQVIERKETETPQLHVETGNDELTEATNLLYESKLITEDTYESIIKYLEK